MAVPAVTSAKPSPSPKPPSGPRDLRLDFFRGLALFFIFIDHIPENFLSYFTLKSIGFSDAAEVFIFISGYTAALVFGQAWQRRGPLYAAAVVYHRVWQLYVAHLFLFVIFMAEVSYTVARFQNPMYTEEMRVGQFLSEPYDAIVNALVLRFQPAFLDILPLYIVLLGVFPLILLLLTRSRWLAFVPSFALYLATLIFSLSFHSYPKGNVWFFNPFAWQFLFVLGTICGYSQVTGQKILPQRRWTLPVAGLIAGAAGVIALTWDIHGVWDRFPGLFLEWLWPYVRDKTDLAPLRVIDFLAMAIVVVDLTPRGARWFHSRAAALIILCGQHSLQVFCLGILLSALGHVILTEFHGGFLMQVAVNLAGMGAMIATALLIDWYKYISRAAPPSTQARPSVGD